MILHRIVWNLDWTRRRHIFKIKSFKLYLKSCVVTTFLVVESVLIKVDEHISDFTTFDWWASFKWHHIFEVQDCDAFIVCVVAEAKLQFLVLYERLQLLLIVWVDRILSNFNHFQLGTFKFDFLHGSVIDGKLKLLNRFTVDFLVSFDIWSFFEIDWQFLPITWRININKWSQVEVILINIRNVDPIVLNWVTLDFLNSLKGAILSWLDDVNRVRLVDEEAQAILAELETPYVLLSRVNYFVLIGFQINAHQLLPVVQVNVIEIGVHSRLIWQFTVH